LSLRLIKVNIKKRVDRYIPASKGITNGMFRGIVGNISGLRGKLWE
jgi:hypothetical protein